MDSLSIIANGLVLTCDQQGRAGRCSILIRDGKIGDISDSATFLASLYPQATLIDASQKLIVPGFVNAHSHAESILLQPLTAGRHFGTWRHDALLAGIGGALGAPEATDDLRSLYQTIYFGHLKNGTTCVGEMPLPVDGKGISFLQQGIERAGARVIVTLQTWDHIAYAREHERGRQHVAVSAGHEEEYTVYSISNFVRVAREFGVPLVAPVCETREEAELVRRNFQKSSIAVLHDFAALTPETLLVHANHATAADMDMAAEAGSSLALCARSAAFKRTGYPVLRHLKPSGINLCLGTDWGHMDLMEEMRFLRQLPDLFPSVPSFPAADLLSMATLNGARALGMGSDIGSLEPGKRADMIFFTLPTFRIPLYGEADSEENLAAYLVDNLTTHDISDVMVDGKFVVAGRELRTIPEENLTASFRRLQTKYLPADVLRKPAARVEEFRMKPRIVPLIPPVSDEELEGFEEGFTIVERPTQPLPESPKPPLTVVRTNPPQDKPITRPELSKNVRRVFGDEDDPGLA